MRVPRIDRLTATDVRLAVTMLLAGFVCVFVVQMPLPAQVVVGAPLFEEAFKFGLALLPCALLGVRSLVVRVPWAWLVGAGFGLLEHWVTYPDEPTVVLYGRLAFHGLATGLSMVVHQSLMAVGRRATLASTLLASFLHAGNNTMAMWLLGAALAGAPITEPLSLSVAAGFVLLLALASLTAPLWLPRYKAGVVRQVVPRLSSSFLS